ncbi:Hypothetical predicted protein, partial [Pelobates cultripes]
MEKTTNSNPYGVAIPHLVSQRDIMYIVFPPLPSLKPPVNTPTRPIKNIRYTYANATLDSACSRYNAHRKMGPHIISSQCHKIFTSPTQTLMILRPATNTKPMNRRPQHLAITPHP